MPANTSQHKKRNANIEHASSFARQMPNKSNQAQQSANHTPVFLQQRSPTNSTPDSAINTKPIEKTVVVQAKSTVGSPEDTYEQQANQVAQKVTSMSDSVVAQPFEQTETPEIQTKEKIPAYLQQNCHECQKKVQQEKLKQSQPPPVLQAKTASNSAGNHPVNHIGQASSIVPSSSAGNTLNNHVRSKIEPVLGSDMGHVRVHDDTPANQAASSLNAKAFTHQNHIYLGQGESARDLNLMAHEATHVVQQGGNKQVPVIQRRARDFQVRGRNPDSTSFPKIAFYNYASSWLHPEERVKVDALAMPADRDLELRGFASEEGDTADNGALVDRRIGSVKNRLLSRGHEAANISETPRLADGENQIDYRRWRAVEMVESGVPADTPECATEPEFETPCPATKSTRIQTGINRSRDMIDESISQLAAPAANPNAQVLLNQLFTGAGLADVIAGLSTIKIHLSTYAANVPQCATACHSDCKDTLAYNSPDFTPDAMVICPDFYTAGDADYAAVTLLHEASHAAPGMQSSDHAYEWDRLLDQLSDAESLDNADSYTMLVYLIHHPGARSIGPDTDDTTNITDAGELAQVEPSVARVEQWITNATTETQTLYSEISDARVSGVWNNSWYEDVMSHASNHFPLTTPPGIPVMQDQERVAAIYDRFNTMGNAMGQILDIRKRNGSVAHWQSGPGVIVEVGPTFFGRSQPEQIEILLAALVRATPGISTAYHVKYVEYTKDLRTM